VTNRSKHEIFASILQSASQDREGMIMTKLMYSTFLSYTQIREYLRELIGYGLLEYQKDTTKYTVTLKGHRFLHLVEEMGDILKVRPMPEYN
jgi:predicted transcriptional regulator